MERELRIVVIVFLTYLIFGISSWFSTGSLVTPVFLTKPVLLVVALVIWGINIREVKSWVLVYWITALICLALTDDFVLSWLYLRLGVDVMGDPEQSWWILLTTFVFFYSFLVFSVVFFARQVKVNWQIIFLAGCLFLSLAFFLTQWSLAREISIQLFLTSYFIFSQRCSGLTDKVLRLISYQFLLLFLLESFEYFV